jgi:hypothetical protein
MALEASPPVEELSQGQQARADRLQGEIVKAQADAESLRKRASLLGGALLASSTVQSQLSERLSSSTDLDLSRILDDRRQYTITNVHRMALGVTSFVFSDDAPENADQNLLGIRFDIHRRGGTTETPYYILCRRSLHKDGPIEIHQHTIPAHIPLAQYQEKCLGLSDDSFVSEDKDGFRSGLESLVHRVRTDLVAWRLRQDTVAAVLQKLGLSGSENSKTIRYARDSASACGVAAFDAVAEDTYYARIVWLNGRVGRLKIGKDLHIEQAVVYGKVNGQEQRCADYERAVLGGDGQLDTLVDRLKSLNEVG